MVGVKLAIVHYHLRRGGVTQVILLAAAEAAARGHKVVVLAGEPPAGRLVMPPGVMLQVVEGLGYTPAGEHGVPATALVQRIEAAARRALGSLPDLWCLHNHSLGKNPSYAALPASLAARGAALLLHLHDFAEDGRPENYASLEAGLKTLYPCGGRIRYAVLNDRDREALVRAGLDSAHIAVVPNPVSPPRGAPTSPAPASNDLLLYPARGIRRKNIGEAILLALALDGRLRVALSLPPESPAERHAYDAWAKFATQNKIPIHLAAAEASGGELGDLLHEARAVVTTSVKEGFGLAFLEPWLAARAVVGRDLPHATNGFRQQGVALHALYHRMPVPLAWIGGLCCLRTAVRNALKHTFSLYRREMSEADVEAALGSMADTNGLADFGRLSPDMQRMAIAHLQRERDTSTLAPALALFDNLPGNEEIARNASIIQAAYSPAAHFKSLLALGQQAANGAPGHSHLSAGRVLNAFLAPETFNLTTCPSELVPPNSGQPPYSNP